MRIQRPTQAARAQVVTEVQQQRHAVLQRGARIVAARGLDLDAADELMIVTCLMRQLCAATERALVRARLVVEAAQPRAGGVELVAQAAAGAARYARAGAQLEPRVFVE